MANLTPQALVPLPVQSQLDLDEIQGDVLLGLQKDHEIFLFFEITNVAEFKRLLRRKLMRHVTSTRDVRRREFELRDHKAQHHSTRLNLVGLNVGFTARGIAQLKPGANLGDTSFATGAPARAADPNPTPDGVPILPINDPVDGDGHLTTWRQDFVTGPIDGVFIITAGTQAAVLNEVNSVLGVLAGAAREVTREHGEVRPGAARGHEHFGWLDGVSQPAIAGLSDPFPGQAEVPAGKFVFGYPGAPPAPEPWMHNGSFMVFRRLKQLVPEFSSFLLSEGGRLGLDPVLLGARLVGRWKSGAPLDLTPMQDDTGMGGDATRNNHFDYQDDQAQRRCPFSAHIRKTNPRGDFAALPPDALDSRRIMRAGIPFGPEVSPAEQAAGATQADRGLLFVCYQTSILRQFEFVQGSWANNSQFVSPAVPKPRPGTGVPAVVGVDIIIGQAAPGVATREADEPIPNYPADTIPTTGVAQAATTAGAVPMRGIRSTTVAPTHWVVPQGGAYFFIPSLEALRTDLS